MSTSSWADWLRVPAQMVEIGLTVIDAGAKTMRLRLDAKRDEVIQRYNRVLQEHREQQMRAEKAATR